MIGKVLIMIFAVAAYLTGTASLLALVLFLSGWAPGFSVDEGTESPIPEALLVNSGLLILWAMQHIGMARPGFKMRLQRWLPTVLERSNYVLFTGLSLGLVLIFWRPMPQTLFAVTHPVGIIGVHVVFLAGWVFAFAGILYDSYPEFVGLKQAYCHVRGLMFTSSGFKTGFVFRLCRRPTFFGTLVGCWATPVMTVGHAFFAAGMTAVILVGCYFAERSYLSLYGDAYREYQAATPLLLPRLRALRRHAPVAEPTVQ